MDWLSLISAFGLGASVSTLLGFFLTTARMKNDRLFTERKLSYFDCLEAIARTKSENSLEAQMNFAMAREKIRIFGSVNMNKAMEGYLNDTSNIDVLVNPMKKDLGFKTRL